MEDLYIQNYGKQRIVCTIGWNDDNVLVEDIKTELRYVMNWELFLKHHQILEDYEGDVSDYIGPDLDIKRGE